MLQKLENLYLAILRTVVILVAGVLLVAVAMLGLNSFRALQPEPVEKEAAPAVSDDSVRKSLLQAPASAEGNAPATAVRDRQDPLQPHYDRAADAIVAYVAAHSGGTQSVDKARVASVIRERAAKYEKQQLAGAYAKNFADSVGRLLKDQAVIAKAAETSAVAVVDRLLRVFTEQFDTQVERNATENQARQQAYLEKKAEGLQSLYMAGGAFAAFLMIVFLSIIIRIERNLRHLEVRAA
jgi:hypothetical protein